MSEAPDSGIIGDAVPATHRELLESARRLGLTGIHRLTKAELAERVRREVERLAGPESAPDVARKFDLGPGPVDPTGAMPDIPWGYGQDRITAMAIDPERLYVYWEVTDAAIAKARAALGAGGADAWLTLWIYDVSNRIYCRTGVAAFARDPSRRSRSGARARAIPATGTTAISIARSDSTCRWTTSARICTPTDTGRTPASSTTRSPTVSSTTSGSTTPTSRGSAPGSTRPTSGRRGSSRSSGSRPAWIARPSSSAPTMRSCSATGGTRGRSSSAISSASSTTTSGTSRRSRPGTTSNGTRPIRRRRRPRPHGGGRATRGTGSTRATRGSTGTSTRRASAWSSWPIGTLLTKAALYRSTSLTTVSRTYAREIQTPAYGSGLDGVVAERGAELVGVTNGIDMDEWNPATDPHLAAHFDADALAGKALCKADLQREAKLPERPDVPIIALVTRLAEQKGIDVFAQALDRILAWHVQVVLLGSGDPEAERFFTARAGAHADRFCAWFPFDDARAHRVQAGADFFAMPSRFEPCGLGQLYAKRYGTLPVVRATGGLVDTVTSYDEASGGGTGFVFHDLDPRSLADTIGWAVSTWYDRPRHIELMRRRAMRDDHSWARAAREYVEIYRTAYARRRGHPYPGAVAAERPAARAPRPRPTLAGERRPSADRVGGD